MERGESTEPEDAREPHRRPMIDPSVDDTGLDRLKDSVRVIEKDRSTTEEVAGNDRAREREESLGLCGWTERIEVRAALHLGRGGGREHTGRSDRDREKDPRSPSFHTLHTRAPIPLRTAQRAHVLSRHADAQTRL